MNHVLRAVDHRTTECINCGVTWQSLNQRDYINLTQMGKCNGPATHTVEIRRRTIPERLRYLAAELETRPDSEGIFIAVVIGLDMILEEMREDLRCQPDDPQTTSSTTSP